MGRSEFRKTPNRTETLESIAIKKIVTVDYIRETTHDTKFDENLFLIHGLRCRWVQLVHATFCNFFISLIFFSVAHVHFRRIDGF